jgi:hypothetical protein
MASQMTLPVARRIYGTRILLATLKPYKPAKVTTVRIGSQLTCVDTVSCMFAADDVLIFTGMSVYTCRKGGSAKVSGPKAS